MLKAAQQLRPRHPQRQERTSGRWACGCWEATGGDPQFRLQRRFAPGFYMLEVQLDLPQAHAQSRIYVDFGSGEQEETSMPLPLRDGRLAKRLLWLRHPARLRFDPTDYPGKLSIHHFRIKRVPRWFAVSRIKKKLRKAGGLGTHQALGESDSAIGPWLLTQPTALEELWNHYSQLFEKGFSRGPSYDAWIQHCEAPSLPRSTDVKRHLKEWRYLPKISIITPTYNTNYQALMACAESVLNQTYPHFQWCIADDASTDPQVLRLLQELKNKDERIHVSFRETNGHISAASNTALENATGEWLALLDHDDVLAPHALYSVVEALQNHPHAAVVYSDEDRLDARGRRCSPFFKPDWSLDQFLGQNYICHLTVMRHDLVSAVGGFREGFEGSQDYDLLLRCIAEIHSSQIIHVPRILYHWRQIEDSTATNHDEKPYATDAALRALREYLEGQARHENRPNAVPHTTVLRPGLYRQHFPVPEPAPQVSILIPTRDNHDLLRNCVESLLHRTDYPHFEILIIDNQSSCPETLRYLSEKESNTATAAQQAPRKIPETSAIDAAPPSIASRLTRVLRYDAPFNYSAINNFAARQATGEVLVLLNNDVEAINSTWLRDLVSHCIRPDVGCVGAKLYYPDETIQHAGVIVGLGGVAGHSHKYAPRQTPGYYARLCITHEVSAVTGAALAVRRSLFHEVGGLDEENLQVAFNDVDFCLKIRERGYRNLIVPTAELYHYESRSRGADNTQEKQQRFSAEVRTMQKRWGRTLQVDPYYNPNLTLDREDYSLAERAYVVPHAATRRTR